MKFPVTLIDALEVVYVTIKTLTNRYRERSRQSGCKETKLDQDSFEKVTPPFTDGLRGPEVGLGMGTL